MERRAGKVVTMRVNDSQKLTYWKQKWGRRRGVTGGRCGFKKSDSRAWLTVEDV